MPRLQIDRHAFAELIQAAACSLPPEYSERLLREAALFFEQCSNSSGVTASLDLESSLRLAPP